MKTFAININQHNFFQQHFFLIGISIYNTKSFCFSEAMLVIAVSAVSLCWNQYSSIWTLKFIVNTFRISDGKIILFNNFWGVSRFCDTHHTEAYSMTLSFFKLLKSLKLFSSSFFQLVLWLLYIVSECLNIYQIPFMVVLSDSIDTGIPVSLMNTTLPSKNPVQYRYQT